MPDRPTPTTGPEALSAETLGRFLNLLDKDRQRAAEKYKLLHCKLANFFAWRQFENAEELADKTIDRILGKVAETPIADINRYAYGVAKYVSMEWERSRRRILTIDNRPNRQPRSIDATQGSEQGVQESISEALLECLEGCLDKLPVQSRQVILEYHQDSAHGKIEHRREIAARLGMTSEALRVKTHRIRMGLEGCVHRCTQRKASAGES